MGTWSATILGNDTSCEVHERFIELYDLGEDPKKIAVILLEEQKDNLKYDRTNIWLGLALACWECKVLTDEVFLEVKKIVDSKEDIENCKEFKADDKFIRDRQKVLNEFIEKIFEEKDKPRSRKKKPVQVESIYRAGQCAVYKNEFGNHIGIYIIISEHYKNKGNLAFIFLDYEKKSIPTLKQLQGSKLLWLKKNSKEWGSCEYYGHKKGINYDKSNKQECLNFLKDNFVIVGELKTFDLDKIAFHYHWRNVDFADSQKVLFALEEQRKEDAKDLSPSRHTLEELVKIIGKS